MDTRSWPISEIHFRLSVQASYATSLYTGREEAAQSAGFLADSFALATRRDNPALRTQPLAGSSRLPSPQGHARELGPGSRCALRVFPRGKVRSALDSSLSI